VRKITIEKVGGGHEWKKAADFSVWPNGKDWNWEGDEWKGVTFFRADAAYVSKRKCVELTCKLPVHWSIIV
jgi:hypothetical protein